MFMRASRSDPSLTARSMQALIQVAAERGNTRMLLQSQCSAEGFYARLGFMAIGAPTIEAGILHIDMVRELTARRGVASNQAA